MGQTDGKSISDRGKRKQRSNSNSRSNSYSGNWNFVQSTLSNLEKESVNAWLEENPDLFSHLDYYARHGIKFSLTYQESTSSYIYAATDKNPESVNVDTTFSSHHRTAFKAMACTLWKLEFKLTLDSTWREAKGLDEDWG